MQFIDCTDPPQEMENTHGWNKNFYLTNWGGKYKHIYIYKQNIKFQNHSVFSKFVIQKF